MKMLTVRELAAYVGVSRQYIEQLIAAGKMPEPDALTMQERPLWSMDTAERMKAERSK